MRAYVQDLRELLGSASIMEQKAFLKSFVKSVEVSSLEVKVNYTMPMPVLGAETETVGETVLGTVQDGGPFWIRTRDLTLIRRAL